MANEPPLYSQSVHLGNATVTDGIDNTFHPISLTQQAVLGTSQYANPMYPHADVSQTFANPTYRPMQIMDVQSYGTGLSQDVIHKIQDLKLLINKYPQYCPDGLYLIPSTVTTRF
jgi:hypothetical protein